MRILGRTLSVSTLIIAWFALVTLFPAAVLAQAVRLKLHPLPTTTLSDREFLTGIKEGKPTVVAGELRLPSAGSDRLPAVLLVHGSGGVETRETGWAIGEAHKRHSRMRNFAEGVRGYLFQGRFGSCVLDEKHLAAAVRYVENNPVRAGMVKRTWEYPWSSAKFHIGEQKVDVLVKDRNLLGLVANWREFL
jgi:hypothetical protein